MDSSEYKLFISKSFLCPVFQNNHVCFYLNRYDQQFIENAIRWSNTYYGGRDIKVTRVIFVNGSIDPWHKLGITAKNETTSENVVIFINGQ